MTTPESIIGIDVFLTDIDGIGGRLKRSPEDFIVTERSVVPPPEKGQYTAATVTSTNWETNMLMRTFARKLGVSRQNIFFAGTKDKRAVTTQLMVFKASKSRIEDLNIPRVEIKDVYTTNRRVSIGDLMGNDFKLKVTEIDIDDEKIRETIEVVKERIDALKGFPNFFGPQRFGSIRPFTHKMGMYVTRGDFEKAVIEYLGNPTEMEGEEIYNARKNVEKTQDFGAALRDFPHWMAFERILLDHMYKNPGDYFGAIKAMPESLQMMFIHAYQSYMFNKMISERMKRGIPLNEAIIGDIILPIDRFGLPDHVNYIEVTDVNIEKINKKILQGKAFVSAVLFGWQSILAKGEPGEIEAKIIEEEGVKNDDFIVPDMEKMTSKGSRREILAPLENGIKYKVEDGVAEFEFSLTKGCYATCLMREFMKSEMHNY